MNLPNVPTINVATLRAMLESRQPVTVLDVRPMSQWQEWRIPGSLHADAYDALWANDPHALSDVALPSDAPIVTVCAAGNTSRLAAHQLEARGLMALSLKGGMNEWSLAWNTAEVPLTGTSARVIQVRRTGKGCLSYLIGADDEAVVIDPSLPPEVYMCLADQQGWRITHVLETHIHADHLMRGCVLAEKTGATYRLPNQNRVSFPFTPVKDGDTLTLGSARLMALHTPGHTYESTCYLLDNAALFTGDTVFPAAVGRPDLLADGEGAHDRTQALYRSLQRIFTPDPIALVLPCHSSEPIAFDQQPLAAPLGVIHDRLAPLLESAETFAARTLAKLPPTPANHVRIVAFNESGSLPDNQAELEAGANRCAVGS